LHVQHRGRQQDKQGIQVGLAVRWVVQRTFERIVGVDLFSMS
jgi:hypothetical protein